MKKLILFLIFLLISLAPAFTNAADQGVYVKVIEKAVGSFDEVISKLENSLKASGWEVLASYNSGVPEGCKFKARVFAIHSPSYAKSILSNGVKSAFAIPLRIGVYEDETGINIAVVNPASINRTIIHETKIESLSLATLNQIEDIIVKGVQGNIVKKQIGEIRSKGRVGGMGGGDFPDKIVVAYETQDTKEPTFKKIADNVKKGIISNKKGYNLVYTLDLSDQGVVIYGVTRPTLESRAFKIAGEKRSSDSYRFPGIDHAAAFPIEVIVYKDEGKVKVVTLDEMYRMKLYFEDAGKWAFMKNMRMPGEIEDEILEMVKAGTTRM